MKIKALLISGMFALSLLCANIAVATTATYTYDELNRLTQVSYDDGTVIVYAYDEIGNRTITYSNPKADFTASPTTGVLPLTVNFTDASTGNIVSWQWTFGDGSASNTQQNPTNTYYNVGMYTVSLTATNPAGTNTVTKTNYINVQPCTGPSHVQIVGKSSYAKLQDAYNAAADGDIILAQAQVFAENLNVNRNISVSLAGGYVCDYSTNPGTTKLQGVLTTSSGTLTIKDIILSN